MLASPLYTEVSEKFDAESVQKREADTHRAQAYHSKRESSMSMSSRDMEVSGQFDTVFLATVNRVRTHFPKETEETNRKTVSRVVFILFSE